MPRRSNVGRMNGKDYLGRALEAEDQRDAEMHWRPLPVLNSPWGEVQPTWKQLGTHVWSVHTAGHGGIYAEPPVVNAAIPASVLRGLRGRKWFEEDIEMHIAMVFLWEVCSPSAIRREWNEFITRMTFVKIAERMAGECESYHGCLEGILAVKQELIEGGFQEEMDIR